MSKVSNVRNVSILSNVLSLSFFLTFLFEYTHYLRDKMEHFNKTSLLHKAVKTFCIIELTPIDIKFCKQKNMVDYYKVFINIKFTKQNIYECKIYYFIFMDG